DYREGKSINPDSARIIDGWYQKTEHKRRPPITVFDDFWKYSCPSLAAAREASLTDFVDRCMPATVSRATLIGLVAILLWS
ncbi:hypothetical protein WKH35_23430, partial [Pantoea agglomerans]